ncbi:hypothetical protein SAMN05421821_105149 [Mucilaginibacter lappiensis]|uniref:Uncharacterized protein n=1 Tax=Mucilaginibacter lappiensis TaxID=354630 RepID=A0ABR6PJC4_9SPHI|nr:hypothetical protein [Mucilaginibacter lappiensis]MBB6109731.1 hypothetical protein [Mucilaginibacter lappiensis]SIR13473.1 hypothetical protein SAMN05421821_105149 [Mucilaginibacter lappiensis]
MSWCKVLNDFWAGDVNAIQAVGSIAGVVITLAGTLYVAMTFHQQKKINKAQEKLNFIALEKDRRELLPQFSGLTLGDGTWDGPDLEFTNYQLFLRNNKALDVEIFPISSNGKILGPRYRPSQVVLPEKDFTTLSIKIATDVAPSEFNKQYLIYYTDEVNRPYTQDVGHDGHKVVVLYPQKVEDDFRKGLPKWQSM